MVNIVIKQLNYKYMKRLETFGKAGNNKKKPLSESVWKADNGMS